MKNRKRNILKFIFPVKFLAKNKPQSLYPTYHSVNVDKPNPTRPTDGPSICPSLVTTDDSYLV